MNHDEKAESYVPDESESLSVVSNSLQPYGLHSSWNSPGQNTGVGSLSLLQGIFPTQGLNPGLLNFRQILYQLSHQGSPRILEWLAYLFPSGSSQPRNQTWVSCIAGRFFTSWATSKAHTFLYILLIAQVSVFYVLISAPYPFYTSVLLALHAHLRNI